MSKYGEARAKLSDADKAAMDNEYRTMKSAGKLSFTSKFTGLSYSIPENIKSKDAPKKEVNTNDFVNSMIGPKTFKSINLAPPKDMVYSKPEPQKIPESFTKVDPEIKQDNTKVDNVDLTPPVVAAEGSKPYYDRMKEHKNSSGVFKLLYGDTSRESSIIPENVRALLSKLATNSYTRDDDTYDKKSKAIIYKVGENAQKRTGKLAAGTEYEDYKGVVSDAEYDQIMKLKKGDVNPIKGAINSINSRGYNIASSLGRFSVAGDGTGKQIVTDSYDFTNNFTDNKDGSLKKDYMSNGKTPNEVMDAYLKDPMKASYRDLRRKLAERDSKLTKKELENLKTSIALTPNDTTGFSKMPKGIIALK